MADHPHFLWADLFRRRNDASGDLIDALRESMLFDSLSHKELKYLSTLVYERVYQPDEIVFRQNERGLGMYLILKGRVAVKTETVYGEHQITVLGERSFFGELALVDPDNIRTATVLALERCVLLGFFKPDLMEILERRPSMGVKILLQLSTVLGRRLLESTEKISLLSRVRVGIRASDEGF